MDWSLLRVDTADCEINLRAVCKDNFSTYKKGKDEVIKGPYTLRPPKGPISGQIVECSFEDQGEKRSILLRIVGQRLFEILNENEPTTEDPYGWVTRK